MSTGSLEVSKKKVLCAVLCCADSLDLLLKLDFLVFETTRTAVFFLKCYPSVHTSGGNEPSFLLFLMSLQQMGVFCIRGIVCIPRRGSSCLPLSHCFISFRSLFMKWSGAQSQSASFSQHSPGCQSCTSGIRMNPSPWLSSAAQSDF